MSVLLDAVGDEFRRIISERKVKVQDAAVELKVSRQALHSYMRGASMPRAETLTRAIDLWGFNLTVGGTVLNPRSAQRNETGARKAEQMSLWEALDGINPQDLKITVSRVGSTLNVDVKIPIPS